MKYLFTTITPPNSKLFAIFAVALLIGPLAASADRLSVAYDFAVSDLPDGLNEGTPPPVTSVVGSFGFTFEANTGNLELAADFVNLSILGVDYTIENTAVTVEDGDVNAITLGGLINGTGTAPFTNDFWVVFFIDDLGDQVAPGVIGNFSLRVEDQSDFWLASGADFSVSRRSTVAAIIGPDGGILTTANGNVMLTIPAGALDNDTSISIADNGGNFQIEVPGWGTSISVFQANLQPAGTVFNQPVDLVFAWPDADDDGIVDGTFGLIPEMFLRVSKDGVVITSECQSSVGCDMSANTFTFAASSFSEFILFGPADTDSDGVWDAFLGQQDNCTDAPNSDQTDSDADMYGNACDADFNNDGVVNGLDVGLFVTQFGTVGPDADFNNDGVVNGLDTGAFVSMFGQAPGPSGQVP